MPGGAGVWSRTARGFPMREVEQLVHRLVVGRAFCGVIPIRCRGEATEVDVCDPFGIRDDAQRMRG